MMPFVTRLVAVGSTLVLLGIGCSREPLSSREELPTVPIPSDFPTDILKYPGARTYAAHIQNGIPTLGQVTSSSTSEVITWINQNYDDATRDLHLFNDQGSIKIYAFQNLDHRYNVRLEINEKDGIMKIVTRKAPISQGDFE